MKKISVHNYLVVLMIINCILFSAGFVLMLVNDGVIHLKNPTPSIDKKLAYEGIYVDLLNHERRISPCNSDETQIFRIDTETGYPAAASYVVIDKNGKDTIHVNTVKFIYQGIPATLRFMNGIANGVMLQPNLSDFSDGNLELDRVWGTDPAFLQNVLKDYSSQVSMLLS